MLFFMGYSSKQYSASEILQKHFLINNIAINITYYDRKLPAFMGIDCQILSDN